MKKRIVIIALAIMMLSVSIAVGTTLAWLMDETEGTAEQDGYIESVELGNVTVDKIVTTQELNNRLEKRLSGEVI